MQIHITKPTWSNHHNIFKDAGVDKKEYNYYKPSTKGLDFEGLISDLKVRYQLQPFLGGCKSSLRKGHANLLYTIPVVPNVPKLCNVCSPHDFELSDSCKCFMLCHFNQCR